MHQLLRTQRDLQATLSNTRQLTATLEKESIATGPDLRASLRQLNCTGASALRRSTARTVCDGPC